MFILLQAISYLVIGTLFFLFVKSLPNIFGPDTLVSRPMCQAVYLCFLSYSFIRRYLRFQDLGLPMEARERAVGGLGLMPVLFLAFWMGVGKNIYIIPIPIALTLLALHEHWRWRKNYKPFLPLKKWL